MAIALISTLIPLGVIAVGWLYRTQRDLSNDMARRHGEWQEFMKANSTEHTLLGERISEASANLGERMKEGDEALNQRLEDFDKNLREKIHDSEKNLIYRIEDVKTSLNQRLDNVDQRLDNVDKRLDNVDKRLDNVDDTLGSMVMVLNGISDRLGKMEARQELAETKI